MLIGICYIELDDFDNARIELTKASKLGKEEEVEPWAYSIVIFRFIRKLSNFY